MSSTGSDHAPEFCGRDGEDCETFIRAVRRAAFRAGKSRDNDWMADYASTCFTGPAFRWYESLDSSVREDWNALKNALLEKYPHEDEVATTNNIPTPAAASPASPPLSAGAPPPSSRAPPPASSPPLPPPPSQGQRNPPPDRCLRCGNPTGSLLPGHCFECMMTNTLTGYGQLPGPAGNITRGNQRSYTDYDSPPRRPEYRNAPPPAPDGCANQ